MPICLTVAATPGTAWVISREALRLFVDGSILVEWSDAQGVQQEPGNWTLRDTLFAGCAQADLLREDDAHRAVIERRSCCV
jgi:hypothetical protein